MEPPDSNLRAKLDEKKRKGIHFEDLPSELYIEYASVGGSERRCKKLKVKKLSLPYFGTVVTPLRPFETPSSNDSIALNEIL